MFRSSTPESRLQARRDAVVIGATQTRVTAQVVASRPAQALVAVAARVAPPLAVTGLFTVIILAVELVERINL